MDLIEALAEIDRLKANAEKGKRKYQKQLLRLQTAVAHRNNFKRQLLKATAERDAAKETLDRWHELNLQRETKMEELRALVDGSVCNVGLCEGRDLTPSEEAECGVTRTAEGGFTFGAKTRITHISCCGSCPGGCVIT